MQIRNGVMSFAVGLLFAVICIGLLPFLVIASFTELTMFQEFLPFLLLEKLYGKPKRDKPH